MRAILLLTTLALATATHAQWQIQDANTTASLRGIHSVGNGVAWASGTEGTMLRTEDSGKTWQHCAIPPDAEKLDFRGIQAFDNKTAIVMSSGKGDLSRLYKTTDGCHTWKLVFTNPDKDGFWDAVTARIVTVANTPLCQADNRVIRGLLFGDPAVHKASEWDTTQHLSFFLASFSINTTCDGDKLNRSASALFSGPGEAAFAASNSVLLQPGPQIAWILSARALIQYETGTSIPHNDEVEKICPITIPIQHETASQGAFSIAVRPGSIQGEHAVKLSSNFQCQKADMVVVGGDYEAPDKTEGTAAFTAGGNKFHVAQSPPHGYRSSVAYDAATKTWITVGPNGTDISTDDGRNWRPLTSSSIDAPDADKNWNALSLPFVVGPHGRIGILRDGVLAPHQ